MTTFEVLMSMVVLIVAAAGTLGSISSSVALGDSTRDTTVAYAAAQQALEQLQAARFRDIFALFNADPADDPGGAGSAPGANFQVTGLNAQNGDGDGLAGRIIFPPSAAGPGVLREDAVDADFGFPRDINADGAVDALDHSGDYVVLPVRVRIEWRGPTGNRAVELQTILNGI